MNKLLHIPLILAGLTIASVGLTAERNDTEAGAYVGGAVGYYRLNDDDFLDEDDELKDNRSAWRAYAGIEVGRIFALEGAYTDFGETSDGLAKTELTGLSGAALINIPVLDFMAPYGKVGMISWDRERSFGSLSDNDEGEDVFFGLGARFSLAPSADMRLEYERYEIDDMDLDMASINLQFRF